MTATFKVLSFIYLDKTSKNDLDDFTKIHSVFNLEGERFLNDVLFPFARTYEEVCKGGYTCTSEVHTREVETLRRLLGR